MMLKKIYEDASKELELPNSLVTSTYRAYWQFIKSSIEILPLKEDLSEEEFNNLRVNFNIPSIGKLNCTYRKYQGMKKRFNILKSIKNENKKD